MYAIFFFFFTFRTIYVDLLRLFLIFLPTHFYFDKNIALLLLRINNNYTILD